MEISAIVRDVELPSTAPLAAVIGRNCREIRGAANISQNELAKYARGSGLRWTTTSIVRDFESGRSAPTFATVLTVCRALSYATGQDVTLADLLRPPEGVEKIQLNDKFVVDAAKVLAVALGEPWPTLDESDETASLYSELLSQTSTTKRRDDLARIQARSGLDEQRLAKRINISAQDLAEVSLRMWGRSFSDERDHRAGTDANQQKRGRVSRELQTELQKALGHGNNK